MDFFLYLNQVYQNCKKYLIINHHRMCFYQFQLLMNFCLKYNLDFLKLQSPDMIISSDLVVTLFSLNFIYEEFLFQSEIFIVTELSL